MYLYTPSNTSTELSIAYQITRMTVQLYPAQTICLYLWSNKLVTFFFHARLSSLWLSFSFSHLYVYTSTIHSQVRVSQLHQETQAQQGLVESYFPAACMPKITPSNNPIVAVDPNPMGMVCVHSSASLGLKSASYPTFYFMFLFHPRVSLLRSYALTRHPWSCQIVGKATRSSCIELDWLCFQNMLSTNLEQYSPHKLRKRADGKQKRTSRSVFLDILTKNTSDGFVNIYELCLALLSTH